MILRNPIYTPTIIFKPIKDMQQHTACLPILRQILVHHRGEMSRLRDTEQEVQCSSNRKLTLQYTWNLSYPFRAEPVIVYDIIIESSLGAQLG